MKADEGIAPQDKEPNASKFNEFDDVLKRMLAPLSSLAISQEAEENVKIKIA